MHRLFILFSLLVASTAFAEPVRLTCGSPTTVFSIYEQADKVVSILNHPAGIQYTNIATSVPITALEGLNAQAEVVKKLGTAQTFLWPKDKCSMSADHILSCTDGGFTTVNGVEMRMVSLRSYTDHIVMSQGSYDLFNLSVVFMVENVPSVKNMIFTLGSNYVFEHDCH